jgi:hypothetical protein
MAIVSVNILHDGWTGSEAAGAKPKFTVVYLVEVDDKNDGAKIVMDADDGTTRIPRFNEIYSVGNESDSFAVAQTKSPTPIDDKFWHVTVTFGAPGTLVGQDFNAWAREVAGAPIDDGDPPKPTEDVFEWRVNCSIQTVNAIRVAERGAYIGKAFLPIGGSPWDAGNFNANGFSPGKPPVSLNAEGDGLGRITNGVPITNSVFTPFDPPPEIAYNQYRITCTMNVRSYPQWLLTKVNSVNNDLVWFTGPGLRLRAQPYTARYMGINVSESIANGQVFSRLELEFLIDPIFGWRLDILDRGYCIKSNNKELSEGAPAKNNVVDEKGNQISEPILLDGAGNKLDVEYYQACYLRYAVYPEINFRAGALTNFRALHKRIK